MATPQDPVPEKEIATLICSGTGKISGLANSFVRTQGTLRSAGHKLVVERVMQSDATLYMIASATEQDAGPLDIQKSLAIFKAKLGHSEDQSLVREYLYRLFKAMLPILSAGIQTFNKYRHGTTESGPSVSSASKTMARSASRSSVQSSVVDKDLATAESGASPAKRPKTVAPSLAPVAGPSQRRPLTPSNESVVKPKPKQPPNLFVTKEFNKSNRPHYPALPETRNQPIAPIESIRNARLFATHQLEVQAAKAAQPEKRKRY